jgi:2-oxoisovalerate dehydrogenase E1 component alpha subunit
MFQVREARKYALENNAPVLIEAMTYRQSHHSTSDDSSRYRSPKEVERVAKSFDPILRLERFLKHHDWLSDEEAALIRDQEKFAVLAAMNKAEKRPKPHLDELFTDVYYDMPPHLKEQKAQLMAHLAKYPNAYH